MVDNFKLDIKNKANVIAWLNRIREGSGNAIPLWQAVTPKIVEFVDYELDPQRDAHKMWKPLSQKYLDWKIRVRGVSGIGYLSGTMQDAAGKSAVKTYTEKSLLWKLNGSVTKANSKNGYDYSLAFHFGRNQGFSKKAEKILKKAGKLNKQPARPLYKYTSLRINNFLKLDAKQFSNGNVHANFTYNWLRKSLESYKG